MKDVDIADKYRGKFIAEGWLNALLAGGCVGFLSFSICAFLFWYFGINLLWLSAVTLLVPIGISAPLFYFFRFRPTDASVAKKLDETGLEERVITMTQYREDESFIASLQRKDALEKVRSVDLQKIKTRVFLPIVIALSVTFALAIGTATIWFGGALSPKTMPVGPATPQDADGRVESYEILYEVGSGEGIIEGDVFQVVEAGGNTEPVFAVADDGWVFYGWTDGGKEPYRKEENVCRNETYYAVFVELDADPDGENGETGEEADSAEDEPRASDAKGSGGESGDGKDSETTGSAGSGEPLSEMLINQVIDGKTYYGDMYDGFAADAMEELSKDSESTAEEKDVINEYYKTIGRKKQSEGEQ